MDWGSPETWENWYRIPNLRRDSCGQTLHELAIDCQDIETQLKAALDAFNADTAQRTCSHCGVLFPDPAQQPPWQQMVGA
ncbi:hypothetical protein C2W62_16315 [Candidatus Entotheonella serta]|nr:hypothetical protein C2W62_16315 [Candidatus Entotheonella serta]